jgi:hypothetical protein
VEGDEDAGAVGLDEGFINELHQPTKSSARIPRQPKAAGLVFFAGATICARDEPPFKSRPQCLHTTAASWISSAQKGHVFMLK